MATYEDASVLLQLLQWGATSGLEDALRRVFDPAFAVHPDPDASGGDPAVGVALTFFETAGALVKHGVLDIDLLHDTYWVAGVWSRVSAYALAMRAHASEPRLYENFEALARYAG